MFFIAINNKIQCHRWAMKARVRFFAKNAKTPPRVRLKLGQRICIECVFWLLVCVQIVAANRPPRFLIDGRSEIVIRLKEGPDTPVGKLVIGYSWACVIIYFIGTIIRWLAKDLTSSWHVYLLSIDLINQYLFHKNPCKNVFCFQINKIIRNCRFYLGTYVGIIQIQFFETIDPLS